MENEAAMNDEEQRDLYRRALSEFGMLLMKEIRDPAMLNCEMECDGYFPIGKDLQTTEPEIDRITATMNSEQRKALATLVRLAVDETIYFLINHIDAGAKLKLLINVDDEFVNLKEAGDAESEGLMLEPINWAYGYSAYGLPWDGHLYIDE